MFRKIIIAALLIIGLAGCKSTTPEAVMKKQCEENRTAIEKTILEPERVATMLGIINSFEQDILAIAEDSTRAKDRYKTALRNYDTTPKELQVLQQEMKSCLDRLNATSKEHSLNLRKQCSIQEWKEITAHYHKLKNVVYF